jgi:acyl-coenzyme A thioesterase PaaI-like protein
MHPKLFRILLNLYPPYWGTGIHIKNIASDYSQITVQMKQRFYNRNYVGTHFGGSLYAMTDPFYMLMLLKILGKPYFVWDQAANIEFIKPGKGTVTAHFKITSRLIEGIKRNTADGNKYLPQLPVEIRDEDDVLVARVVKTIYIRKKKNKPPAL